MQRKKWMCKVTFSFYEVFHRKHVTDMTTGNRNGKSEREGGERANQHTTSLSTRVLSWWILYSWCLSTIWGKVSLKSFLGNRVMRYSRLARTSAGPFGSEGILVDLIVTNPRLVKNTNYRPIKLWHSPCSSLLIPNFSVAVRLFFTLKMSEIRARFLFIPGEVEKMQLPLVSSYCSSGTCYWRSFATRNTNEWSSKKKLI